VGGSSQVTALAIDSTAVTKVAEKGPVAKAGQIHQAMDRTWKLETKCNLEKTHDNAHMHTAITLTLYVDMQDKNRS
jgi:hypothetical protein